MAHTDVSPSYLAIAIQCPASVTKARGKVSLSGPAARRGTALHKCVEERLNGKPLPDSVDIEGSIYTLTDDDRDAVELCVTVGELLRFNANEFELEKKLKWAEEKGAEPFAGTTDLVAYEASAKRLTVADWKFGRHIVDPLGPQNLSYAAMAYFGKDEPTLIDEVRLVIVQPQDEANPIKSEVITERELMQWSFNVLDPTLERIGAGDTTENPGEHCTWCKRAGECQALHARALEVAKASFDDEVPSPQGFSNDDLGAILDKAELVEGWIRAVRAEASHRIDQGQAVAGWKLVAKRAHRRWIDEQAVRNLLDEDRYLAIPLQETFTPPQLRSPAKVEKALKRHGLKTDVLESLVTRVSSGSTLVKDSDPRQQVIASRGAELFDD